VQVELWDLFVLDGDFFPLEQLENFLNVILNQSGCSKAFERTINVSSILVLVLEKVVKVSVIV
jgi:hypothetical protein